VPLVSLDGNSSATKRIGIVVHPTRDLDTALSALQSWSDSRGIEVVQVPVHGQGREVAEKGDAAGCDLVVAIGGDGTMLAAVRAAADAGRPVLGVACGSLGVLTSVTADQIATALDRFEAGDWVKSPMPGLEADCDGTRILALNDIATIRRGQGQVVTSVELDGVLYARFAGDGVIVSTPLGSSAYTMAAGGPLLAPDAHAFVMTPLSPHGGNAPPLIAGAGSRLELTFEPPYTGTRLEVDGQMTEAEPEALTIQFLPERATLVAFADQEPLFSRLRGRHILMDSPRVIAREARDGHL
jgi:NAD+ kinase